MRTSNKIILTVFLLAVTILSAIHITIYAKYKSGNIVTLKDLREDRFHRHALKKINYVSVKGLHSFNLIASDTASLEIQKNDNRHLQFWIAGDSLIIKGDTLIRNPNGTILHQLSYEEINLYMPFLEKIEAEDCEIHVEGRNSEKGAPSYNLNLNSSNLVFDVAYDDTTSKFYNVINIMADSSSRINLSDKTNISELNLRLADSEFTDSRATLGKFFLAADQYSSIYLTGENLKKMVLFDKQPK